MPLLLPWPQVLSDWPTTRHLKLINTTEILHYFRVLVSKPFFISQGGARWDNRACHPQCEEEIASSGQQLILRPQENILVSAGVCHLPPHLYRQHIHVTCSHLGTRYKWTVIGPCPRHVPFNIHSPSAQVIYR